MVDKVKFMNLYNRCFDEHGNVKACGRQACMDLLQALDSPKYGNIATGRLKVEAVNDLYRKMKI